VSKAQKPSAAEIARNPRSRSSTIRSAIRTALPARAINYEGLGVPQVRGAA
jgi:16S rRNA (cytosine1402-N4)-methyltransferase